MNPPCSDAARERRDPLVGTAPPARRWLLVEQPAGWGRVTLSSLRAPGVDHTRLADALAAHGARLQLIRRPGGRGKAVTEESRRWAVIDTGSPRTQVWGALADGWAAITAALAEPDATTDEPVLLVCTNGRHDVCCAVRGRPVAAALAEAYPAQVWETTHTGGDRFAANLLILPEGACYGGLDPERAVALVEEHRQGRPDLRHLRGVTGRSPQDQAALLAVAPHLGVVPWDRVRLRVHPGPGPAGRGTGWHREVLLDGDPVALVLGHNAIRPPALLTCAATAPTRAAVPTVDAVQWSSRAPSPAVSSRVPPARPTTLPREC